MSKYIAFVLGLLVISACSTLSSVRGEWTGRTRLNTLVSGPHRTEGVLLLIERGPEEYGRTPMGVILVDENSRLVSKKYSGRILRVRGRIKRAPAIDGSTGIAYRTALHRQVPTIVMLVLVAREKDIRDFGPAK